MATNTPTKTRVVTPQVDVYESREDLIILADLPGVPPDALAVRVERNALVIEAPRADGVAFRRAFDVPTIYDTAHVDAELKNGVLRLKLPRAEAAKPRRIEVRAG